MFYVGSSDTKELVSFSTFTNPVSEHEHITNSALAPLTLTNWKGMPLSLPPSNLKPHDSLLFLRRRPHVISPVRSSLTPLAPWAKMVFCEVLTIPWIGWRGKAETVLFSFQDFTCSNSAVRQWIKKRLDISSGDWTLTDMRLSSRGLTRAFSYLMSYKKIAKKYQIIR